MADVFAEEVGISSSKGRFPEPLRSASGVGKKGLADEVVMLKTASTRTFDGLQPRKRANEQRAPQVATSEPTEASFDTIETAGN